MVEASAQRRRARKRLRVLPVLVLLLPWASPLFFHLTSPRLAAQAMSIPVLHRRADGEALEERATATISQGRTTLPSDASGGYSLGETGTIELDLQPDQLSGYISRLGDRESDKGEPLTFFFATSSLRGQQLSFATRQVHGAWFSFTGTLVRGAARSRAEEGYYRLEGRLVHHDALAQTEQSHDVSLPLLRQNSIR